MKKMKKYQYGGPKGTTPGAAERSRKIATAVGSALTGAGVAIQRATTESQKKRLGKALEKGNIKKADRLQKKLDEKNLPEAKKGGTKNSKLAAMAAPKNKITRADIITAAKKKAKKK